jgi:arylsulfatase A-like enzyme
MANGEMPHMKCDGIDLTELIHAKSTLARENLYWHYPHYSDQGGTPSSAIREGDWKLIEFLEDNHLELYNLVEDPGEQYDFASSYSDKAAQLHQKLAVWRTEINAAMPTQNSEYNKAALDNHVGAIGCSADPTAGCRED